MIELNARTQAVAAGDNILFDSTVIKTGCAERHRSDSGIVALALPGKYKVEFNGNIAIPTGGTVGAISMALALNGEPLYGTIMTVTPAAVENFWNISASTVVEVSRCGRCCQSVAVENVSAQPIDVTNGNLVITKVAEGVGYGQTV